MIEKRTSYCPLILLYWWCLVPLYLGYSWYNTYTLVGNNLSPIADSYSEANAVRGASYFYDHGIWSTSGLPDINYGSAFRSHGVASDPLYTSSDEPFIYTHYPPGPEYITYGMGLLCGGTTQLPCIRLFPMILGTIALFVFFYALRLSLTPYSAIAVSSLLLITPLTLNMMHCIHQHGLLFAAFFFQSALFIILFKDTSKPGRVYSLLFFCGFFQGCLSFDFFFVCCFSGIPFFLLISYKQKPVRLWWYAALFLPLFGFIVAHGLHFLQVAYYFNGILPALEEFSNTATKRFDTVEIASKDSPLFYFTSYIITTYLFTYADGPKFFHGLFLPIAGLTLLLLLIRNVSVTLFGLKIQWKQGPGALLAFVTAAIVSLAWIVVMQQHAFHHPHFLPRHFIVFYTICLWIIFEGFRAEAKNHKDDSHD